MGEGRARHFRLLLDGKPVRTPAKKHLVLPTRALADAVAAEWEAQKVRIDPVTMPLTRLANSAIDGVTGREAEVRADIVRYAGSDLVCYRAEGPPELVRRQSQAWDPVLAWAREALGASISSSPRASCRPPSPRRRRQRVARAVEAHEPIRTGRPARDDHADGIGPARAGPCPRASTADDAWAAAHVDEDWQISQWGEDAEAKARRDAALARDAGGQPADCSCSAEPLTSAVSSRFAVQ